MYQRQVRAFEKFFEVLTLIHRHSKSRNHEILKIPKYTRIFYESDWHQIIVSDSVTLKLQMDLCISHSNVVSLSYLMPTFSENSFGLYFQKETPRKIFPLCTTFSPTHGCYDILVISWWGKRYYRIVFSRFFDKDFVYNAILVTAAQYVSHSYWLWKYTPLIYSLRFLRLAAIKLPFT